MVFGDVLDTEMGWRIGFALSVREGFGIDLAYLGCIGCGGASGGRGACCCLEE